MRTMSPPRRRERPDTPISKRLNALQDKLRKSDAEMGRLFNCAGRTFRAWKTAYRKPNGSAILILAQLEKAAWK